MRFRHRGTTRRTSRIPLGIGLAMAIAVIPATALAMRAVYSLSVTPGKLNVGESATGTVVLDQVTRLATDVALSAVPRGVVTVPSTVRVSSRARSARFAIGAAAPGCALIRATHDGRTKTSNVHVHSLSPQVALTTDKDGSRLPATFRGTVRITPPRLITAPRLGHTVSLSSSATSIATVPSSVVVPGGQTSVSFDITATGYGCVVITAAFNGGTSRRALMMYPEG